MPHHNVANPAAADAGDFLPPDKANTVVDPGARERADRYGDVLSRARGYIPRGGGAGEVVLPQGRTWTCVFPFLPLLPLSSFF